MSSQNLIELKVKEVDENNKKYQSYYYNENIDFGLNMYTNLFTENEIYNIEKKIEKNFGWNFTEEKKHHHYPLYKFTNNIKNTLYGLCERKALDTNEICNKCECHMNINTENNLLIPEWIQTNIIEKLIKCKIIPNGWANCATIIMYKNPKLNPHFDSPHIFELPIVTLKLFNDTFLSFDSTKKEILNGDILQKKGNVSVMSGDAAKKWDHSVKKSKNTDYFAVSIIIRRIHPKLVGDKWMLENCKTIQL